ncbi:ATP-binding cassette domain-containing protein [Treponema pedis]|uniref:ATP-binding cassette domain-containing protein n=1 Tax=Treponema pedis TaxID=409322 RepID=UPI0004639238|nr:ABC transporter ATP-binding protein [Treponema pedis]
MKKTPLFFKYWYDAWKNNRLLISCIYFLTLILAVIEIMLPMFFKFFIDKVKQGVDFFSFTGYFCIYGLCLLFSNVLNTSWYQLLDMAGGKMLLSIRENLFYSIENLTLKAITKIGREKLKNILFNDVMQVFSSLIMYSMRIISNFLMLLVFFIVTTIITPLLGLCLFIMSILGFFVSILLRKKIKLYSSIVNTELKKTNAVTNSFIDSIELFKINNLDSYIKDKHHSAMKTFISAVRKSDFIQVFLKNILSNINIMFNLLTLCLVLIIEKNTSPGTLLFLFFVSNIIFSFCTQTEQLFSAVYAALPSFEHIDSIFRIEPQIMGDKNLTKIDTVAFKDVSFYYDENEKIFNKMNAVFSCGEKVKIIGKNGSGKSTFIKLLTSLIEPLDGAIMINGEPISCYRKQDFKQKILYISQDEYIINESISDYFKIMETNLSDTEIEKNLNEWKFNGADKNILNTMLKDNAKNISGGQRKKLLAIKLFAKYKKADIIIIDEIEAGMDIECSELYRQKRNLLLGNCDDKIIFEVSHSNNDDSFFNKTIEL